MIRQKCMMGCLEWSGSYMIIYYINLKTTVSTVSRAFPIPLNLTCFFKSGLFGVSIPGDLSLAEIRSAELNWFDGSRNHQHYVFQQISGLETKTESCETPLIMLLLMLLFPNMGNHPFLKGNVKRNEFLTWLLEGTLWKVQISGSPARLHGSFACP